jgi:hypothetical protein
MQRNNVPPNYKDIKKKVSIIIYLLYSSVSRARGRSKTRTEIEAIAGLGWMPLTSFSSLHEICTNLPLSGGHTYLLHFFSVDIRFSHWILG